MNCRGDPKYSKKVFRKGVGKGDGNLKRKTFLILALLMVSLFVFSGIAFANEADFEFDSDTGTITGYTGPGGDVMIPSQIGGVSVTKIGKRAFYNCTGLTGVTIPNNITVIDTEAFCDCTSLTSVTIPNSVTSIGIGAFRRCTSLMRVGLPNPLPRMGAGCFDETPYQVSILSASFDLEQVRKDSKEAKDKATEAVENALNIISRIDNTTYGLSALNTQINELKNNSATKTDITNLQKTINSLQETMAPIIISIKGHNGATATTSTTISVDVTAANATYYRAGVNGNYTAWQSSPRIDNISLPNSGVNTIEVQATNSLEDGAPVASGYMTVFRL